MTINPLNAKLNPICHLLALLGAHHILHVSRIRVKVDFVEAISADATTVGHNQRFDKPREERRKAVGQFREIVRKSAVF